MVAGLVGVRCAVALRMHWLVSVPDEYGYLGDAWLLGRRRPAPTMVYAPIYKVGYPLLLAPLARLFGSPHGLQLAAIALNAVLVAALFPLLARLLDRLDPDLGPRRLPMAVAAACLPAVWVAVPLARPDALDMALLAAAVLALWRMAAPGPWWGRIGFGPAVAWLWVTHDRFVPVLALTALVLVLRLVAPGPAEGEPGQPHEPGERWPAAVNLALLAVLAAGGYALNRWMVSTRWTTTIPNNTSGVEHHVGGVARSLAGQWWYLICSTYGLGALGAFALAREVVRAVRRARVVAVWQQPLPLVAVFLVGSLLGTQLATAVQLRQAYSVDLLVNGRYQDVLTPVLAAIGLACLYRWVAVGQHVGLLVGAGTAAVGLAVVLVATHLPRPLVETASVSGVGWALRHSLSHPLLGPTVALLIGLVVLDGLGRRQPRALAVVVLIAFTLAGLSETNVLVDRSRVPEPVSELATRLRSIHPPRVTLDSSKDIYTSAQTYWYLAGVQTVEATRPGADPGAVFIVPSNAGTFTVVGPPGSRLVSVAPDGRSAAWVPPGPTQDQLARRGLLYPVALRYEVPEADQKVAISVPHAVHLRHGHAVISVRVTNRGTHTVWPSPFAPGGSALELDISAGRSTARLQLPELGPGQHHTFRFDLGTLTHATPTTAYLEVRQDRPLEHTTSHPVSNPTPLDHYRPPFDAGRTTAQVRIEHG